MTNGKKQDFSRVNGREIVLDLLVEWEKGNIFSHKLIRDVLGKYDYLTGQEKAFIKRLAEGTIERQIELDYIISQVSSVPVKKMKSLIRMLLRMSVYQIFYMDGVPDSAAVSEAVKLAGKRKFQNLKGFVNGVLRSVAKQRETISYPNREERWESALSVRYSMPEWLVKYWEESYGRERTEEILKGLLAVRPVTVRLPLRMQEEERQKWLEKVQSMGVTVQRREKLPYAFDLYGVEGVSTLPGFAEGLFAVQDISSMLAVEAAGIKPGDFVLDICAAPGGKTMLAAEKVLPDGRVQARDVSEQKTLQIEENVERMGLSHVDIKVWDAAVRDEEMEGRADVVLADVPCSGLGVIGKKQDIKYHASLEGMESLVKLQKEIMKNAVAYVKEGGTLLYSTCTIHKKENEEMVQWICENYPFTTESMVQLFPGEAGNDGFFFAKLKKKKA